MPQIRKHWQQSDALKMTAKSKILFLPSLVYLSHISSFLPQTLTLLPMLLESNPYAASFPLLALN
jgi:hypothetical protein